MFFSFLQVKESGDIFDLQLLIYRTKGAYRKSLALGTIGFTQRPRGGQPEAGFPVLQGVRPFSIMDGARRGCGTGDKQLS